MILALLFTFTFSQPLCQSHETECSNYRCDDIYFDHNTWKDVSTGEWIYFNAFFTSDLSKVGGPLQSGRVGRYSFVSQSVSLTNVQQGVTFLSNYPLPDIVFTIRPSTCGNFSTLTYSEANGWNLLQSQSCGAEFAGGGAWQANQTIYASYLPYSLKMTWCRKLITTDIISDDVRLAWFVSASAYREFTTDYSQLSVKPSQYCSNDNHVVGTPTNYIDYHLINRAVTSFNIPYKYTGGFHWPIETNEAYCYCTPTPIIEEPTECPTIAPVNPTEEPPLTTVPPTNDAAYGSLVPSEGTHHRHSVLDLFYIVILMLFLTM